jgi:hypothetical protein
MLRYTTRQHVSFMSSLPSPGELTERTENEISEPVSQQYSIHL